MAKADMAVDVISVEIARLELKPGDVLVVRFPNYRITDEEIEFVRARVKEELPGAGCLVLGKGVELSVIAARAAEAIEEAAGE